MILTNQKTITKDYIKAKQSLKIFLAFFQTINMHSQTSFPFPSSSSCLFPNFSNATTTIQTSKQEKLICNHNNNNNNNKTAKQEKLDIETWIVIW